MNFFEVIFFITVGLQNKTFTDNPQFFDMIYYFTHTSLTTKFKST